MEVEATSGAPKPLVGLAQLRTANSSAPASQTTASNRPVGCNSTLFLQSEFGVSIVSERCHYLVYNPASMNPAIPDLEVLQVIKSRL